MFDPRDWYWIVGGDETRLWSTKAGSYVPATDADFLAWLEAGNVHTQIVSEEDLAGVIGNFRADAYVKEADPLFFKEQAGEVPAGTWSAKRAEIKSRWPKPATEAAA